MCRLDPGRSIIWSRIRIESFSHTTRCISPWTSKQVEQIVTHLHKVIDLISWAPTRLKPRQTNPSRTSLPSSFQLRTSLESRTASRETVHKTTTSPLQTLQIGKLIKGKKVERRVNFTTRLTFQARWKLKRRIWRAFRTCIIFMAHKIYEDIK